MTAPLSSLPPDVTEKPPDPTDPAKAVPIKTFRIDAGDPEAAAPDPVVQDIAPPAAVSPPSLSFEGLSNQDNFNAFGFRLSPPDPDGDVGPNNLLNFPVLTSVNVVGTAFSLTGSLDTLNPSTMTVEIYTSGMPTPGGDPSGFGDGQNFVASVVPNAMGNFTANFTAAPNALVTMIAIDNTGNTSEFSSFRVGVGGNTPDLVLRSLRVTPASVNPGEQIRVEGFIARNGSKQISGKSVVVTRTGRQVYVGANGTARQRPTASGPTPRWPDGRPRLGPPPGETGYWGYPSRGFLLEEPDTKVAASIDNGSVSAIVYRPGIRPGDPGQNWIVQPVREVDPTAGAAVHVVFRGGDTVPLPYTCGNAPVPPRPIPDPIGIDVTLSCDFAIEADLQFYRPADHDPAAIGRLCKRAGPVLGLQLSLRTDDEVAVVERAAAALEDTLGEELRELLSPPEVEATAGRAEELLRVRRFPQPDPSRPALPWPPF